MSSLSLNILPSPFAWLPVSAGKVKLISIVSKEVRGDNYIPKGTSQIFDVPAFEIAKYPLTNAQFATFIKAKGYHRPRWWTEAGWQAKEQNGWTEPLFWQDTRWNQPTYPVVGISWYEAIAFCQWLSGLTGENISLPTEQQWQRAGQGDSERNLAWGNAPDIYDRCNWDTNGTTPVTRYEGKGDSPFGVVDMTGNVWEWCLTKYISGENDLNGTEARIGRGGGWAMMYSHEVNIGLTDRISLAPVHRLNYFGFRCARLPQPERDLN